MPRELPGEEGHPPVLSAEPLLSRHAVQAALPSPVGYCRLLRLLTLLSPSSGFRPRILSAHCAVLLLLHYTSHRVAPLFCVPVYNAAA